MGRRIAAGDLIDFVSLHRPPLDLASVQSGPLPLTPLKTIRVISRRYYRRLKLNHGQCVLPVQGFGAGAPRPWSSARLPLVTPPRPATQVQPPNTLFRLPFFDRVYPAVYPSARLASGMLVHVRFVGFYGGAEFSVSPVRGSRPFCVLGGNPDTGVMLRDRPPADDTKRLILALSGVLDGLLAPSTVRRSVLAAAARIPIKYLHQKDKQEETAYGVLRAVMDRLDLCERLTSEAVASEVRVHQLTLVIYLYLTCFDLLGQPDSWLSFDSWLVASRMQAERAEALETLPSGASPVDAARHLSHVHTQRYGVKRSFFRFIEQVLPEASRADLFASLKLDHQSLTMPIGPAVPGDEAAVKAYLFNLRNSYTHRARYAPGLAIPLPVMMGSSGEDTFTHYEQFMSASYSTSVQLRDWPASLRRTVLQGLVQYLLNSIQEQSC